jgi:hypothetical protein
MKSRAGSRVEQTWEEGKQGSKETEGVEEDSVDKVEGGEEQGEDKGWSIYRLVFGLRIDSRGRV